MNFFTKIFGNNTKTEQPETMIGPETKTGTDQQENIPPVNLFVDNEEPQPLLNATYAETPPSRLSEFLKRDHRSKGIHDGFEYHSQEALENTKKKIKSEFLLVIDQMIGDKRVQIMKLHNHIISVGGISAAIVQQLENTASELSNSIIEMQKQKELSVENEGWVMAAIHNYHEGFIDGLETYLEEDKILNSIKNF